MLRHCYFHKVITGEFEEICNVVFESIECTLVYFSCWLTVDLYLRIGHGTFEYQVDLLSLPGDRNPEGMFIQSLLFSPLTTETLPIFWEAQYNVMQVPFTGMAVTTGTVKSPNDLHPGYKWEVGRRLAQWPLATDYHLKTAPSGPIYKSMKRTASTIELSFNYTGKGLISADGKPLNFFTIAGSDGIFYPATATISGDKVIVQSGKVNNPEQVRFAWDEAADPNFYNKDGLPAMPFRTNPNNHQARL